MRLIQSCLIVLVCTFSVLVAVRASKGVSLIDDRDIDHIANQVCQNKDGYEQQIGRISTIQRLASHLRATDSPHYKKATCKSSYIESIGALSLVVSDQDELCSSQKMKLVEQFHRDYVSTVSKFKDIRKEQGKAAPQMIKVFFRQYASRVSTLCSELATDMLMESSKDVQDREWLEKLLREMGNVEEDLASIRSYDDIMLVWNLLASLPASLSGKLNKYIELEKEVKVTVEVSDSSNMDKLQAACKSIAKPYYSAAILPALRLIDLGYYPESEALLQVFQIDKFSRIIYSFAVLCENFLPVRFIHSPASARPGMLMVEVSSAVAKYGAPAAEHTSPSQITVESKKMDDLIIENPLGAHETAKRIKSQVKARGKVMKQFLKMIVRTVKKKPTSTLDVLFMGDGEAEEPVSPYLAQVDEREIPNISGDDENTDAGQVRERRSVKSILLAPFRALSFVGIAILYFMLIWFPEQIFIPSLVGTVIALEYAIVKPLKFVFRG